MKKLLLTIATAAVTMTCAAQTYNYFDAADVDDEGWLWFDTQAKIDKYVGFGKDYKIQLQPAGYETPTFEVPEPWADPEIPGYNLSGEEGGEGAKFGAIVLNESSSSSGYGKDSPDGGGIMLWLPDCAQMDMFLSSGNDVIVVGLKAGTGDWVEAIDCGVVKTWMKVGSWIKALSEDFQFNFKDVHRYENANAPYTTIASPKGQKVTALMTNNGKELYVHGIRVLTYTQTETAISAAKADGGMKMAAVDGQIVVDRKASIVVYDALGRTVARANGTRVDLSGRTPGMYVAKATDGDTTTTIKVTL